MKTSNSLATLVMLVIAGMLAMYLGYYAWDTFQNPFSTTLAYQFTVSDSAPADGYIVREELVLPGHSGILELSRDEGEKVGANQVVARVYRNAKAQQDQAEIQRLQLEIELLQSAAAGGGEYLSAAKLDEEIITSMAQLRSCAASGGFTHLDRHVMQVKSTVLKREYTFGDDLSASDLTDRAAQLSQQIFQLRSQSSGAVTQVLAPVSGVFSSRVDGYETLLTAEYALSLTPSALDQLDGQGARASDSVPGKLITSNTWYFAAALPVDTAKRLTEGYTATVRFSGEFNQDVPMVVERIGQEENGRCAVVFSSDRYLNQTTLLRQQTAELIFRSQSGLRVPKAALRMWTFNTEDGPEERMGVYVITGGRAEFKPVEILMSGSDFYVVRTVNAGKAAFRAGDQVIVNAVGLYPNMPL